MEIVSWDYTLGHSSEKEPLLLFFPTKDFITLASLNNNNLYVKITGTGEKAYDNKNFFAVIDKSSLTKKGCNIATPCVPDFSVEKIMWSASLPHTEYIENVKGGKISAIDESEGSKKKVEKPKKPVPKKSVQSTPEDKSGLSPLALGLVGVAGVAAIVLIFLLRK